MPAMATLRSSTSTTTRKSHWCGRAAGQCKSSSFAQTLARAAGSTSRRRPLPAQPFDLLTEIVVVAARVAVGDTTGTANTAIWLAPSNAAETGLLTKLALDPAGCSGPPIAGHWDLQFV